MGRGVATCPDDRMPKRCRWAASAVRPVTAMFCGMCLLAVFIGFVVGRCVLYSEGMINELYNARILEFAGNIPRSQRLADADATVVRVSRLCGSKVTVDLKMDGDVVSDFGHEVKACALGQCSSSIMARHVVGSTAEELKALRDIMYKMLKEDGPPPTELAQGKWADLEILAPVRSYKGRHASTLLTFDAVVQAIDEIDAKRGGIEAASPSSPDSPSGLTTTG